MKIMIQNFILGSILLSGQSALADIRLNPFGGGLTDYAGICRTQLDKCLNDIGSIQLGAIISGDLDQAIEDHVDGCLAFYNSCMKNAEKGLPYDPDTDPDVVGEPEPGHNIEPVKMPVAVPVPIDCGPQLVPGDNRTWGEWATDQCTDIWKNRLGLPLPPVPSIPQPDITGFMRDCMEGLRSCPQKPIIHKFCGDGCMGEKCPGAGGGIFFCPTPSPGMPVLPAPVGAPVPVLPFPGLLFP